MTSHIQTATTGPSVNTKNIVNHLVKLRLPVRKNTGGAGGAGPRGAGTHGENTGQSRQTLTDEPLEGPSTDLYMLTEGSHFTHKQPQNRTDSPMQERTTKPPNHTAAFSKEATGPACQQPRPVARAVVYRFLQNR